MAARIVGMPEPSLSSEDDHPYPGAGIQRLPAGGGEASPAHGDIQLSYSGGAGLSPMTRQFMEPRFGVDFGQVRLHRHTRAQDTAAQINARAFTYGNHIWLGKGESEQNRSLMAHELTHVVQQEGGRLQGKFGIGRTADNSEADSGRSATPHRADHANPPSIDPEIDAAIAPEISPGPQDGTLQRGPGAVAAGAGAVALAFLTGFGIAFGIDYLSMTRDRAERYGRDLDTSFPGWRSSLPDCPCTMPASDPANWEADSNPSLSKYHPGAVYSYRSTPAANPGRHGQQCTYDAGGRLITSGAGAGTPDVYAPSSFYNIPYHVVYDVKTWDELGWSTYNRYWVPNTGNNCQSEGQ